MLHILAALVVVIAASPVAARGHDRILGRFADVVQRGGATARYMSDGEQASAPTAPQNLTSFVYGNSVTLDWVAPVVGSLDPNYSFEASYSPGGPSFISVTVPGRAPRLYRTLTGHYLVHLIDVPNGVYYVRVRKLNPTGPSGPSNEVVVEVPGDGGGDCAFAPNAPQFLSPNVNGGTVVLDWLPSTSGCPAETYAVHAGSAPGLSDVAVVNVGRNAGLTTGAPPGTYFVRVVAINAHGGSGASNEIRIFVNAP